ncbi:MAG TPA: DUF255 domain-containing protein, partial [Bacteroidetes bacterium]|nr:DUF255 domain-containing protein [Bacteroidota bacterium]HEX04250.1 DUF255 domain-containing protein [Bacteroidota bacterium]
MSSSRTNGDKSSSLRWLAWDGSAFLLAQESDRPIFLYLYVPWSTAIHGFEQDVLTDEQVIKTLESSYVTVKVNALHRPDVFERYNQGEWPSISLLSPDGDLLHGFSNPRLVHLQDTLEQVAV